MSISRYQLGSSAISCSISCSVLMQRLSNRNRSLLSKRPINWPHRHLPTYGTSFMRCSHLSERFSRHNSRRNDSQCGSLSCSSTRLKCEKSRKSCAKIISISWLIWKIAKTCRTKCCNRMHTHTSLTASWQRHTFYRRHWIICASTASASRSCEPKWKVTSKLVTMGCIKCSIWTHFWMVLHLIRISYERFYTSHISKL